MLSQVWNKPKQLLSPEIKVIVMEEETQASSEVQVKVVDNTENDPDSNAAASIMVGGERKNITNGHLHQEGNKEEEIAMDGEFIKVEKVSLDVKDSFHTDEAASRNDDKPSVIERTSSNSIASRDFLEAQEKMKELELELEKMAGELKHSDSNNALLKEEVLLTKEKLEDSGKHCEELELGQKRLKEQIVEAEEKYNSQLKTLEEALQAQETKYKELTHVKEAYDGLSIELESSRKKMQELEQELESSAGEVQKFEELSKQSGSHAESETQRALEFERLLELAKLSTKEMEDQISSQQEELKGMYEKIAENQRVEEVLRSSVAELSEVQGELELSKSQVVDLEQRLTSKEAVMNELAQELDMRKALEAQMKEDILALENQVSSTKEDLQKKVSELEEIMLKLQQEMNTRELVEVSLKTQETHISTVQEELAKVIGEKNALEVASADLNSTVAEMKDLCSDLETKLKLSDENFCKADSLLSQALSNNAELEQKLKSLEELHQESGVVAATATQKNVELEDIVRASNAAADEAKSELREIETQFISAEKRNVELEQQLNLVELKSSDAERELKELSEKMSEINAVLRGVEEEKTQLTSQTKEYEDKIVQLESTLSQSSLRNSELEMELKDVAERCAEHEGRANTTHQRGLELEDLIQLSHSKVEDAAKKVGELELLLEAANNRIREFEDQASTLETKCGNAEAESMQLSNKLSELGAELEMFQAKASSLEIELQAANDKERKLTECLDAITEEKTKFEEASSISSAKLSEAENLLEVLQTELKLAHEKLESIEYDIKASGMRESEIVEKLKSAEAQLEQQGSLIEQAATRYSELELLHESLSRDSKLKLQEAMVNFTNRDSEAKSLNEKLKILEDQVNIYEERAAEASQQSASLKAELDQSSMKLVALESTIDELKRKVLEAEDRAAVSFSENELLAGTNLQLKSKINELQELLSSACAEKEATSQHLASHVNTISELTDQHSRVLELHSATESRVKEAELQLQEAIESFTQRDLEAKDLNEKLNALGTQIRIYEEQAHETSAISETQKNELEETHLKLKHLESIVEELQTKAGQFEKENEGLTEVNLKLNQELASYEFKMNELQTTLSGVLVEKDETVEQLNSSKQANEGLMQQLTAEGQRLQSQISSVMEENNMLNETYQDARKELQTVINQLEGQLNEQKAREDALNAEMENLKAELTQKSLLQTRVTELEQQLILAENRVKEEVESVRVLAAGKEAELASRLEEHVHKLHDRDALDEQVLQLQRELHLAHTTIAEQKEADCQKELEQEAAVKHSFEELEAKSQQVLFLEKQVEELEQKMQLADLKSKENDEEDKKKLALVYTELDDLKKRSCQTDVLEKKIEELENKLKLTNINSLDQSAIGNPGELKDGLEVKSRDLGLTFSTPSKRKSKKKSEPTSAQTSLASVSHTQTSEVSHAMPFKFILGVALLSVILGIILGKRY
ncbi:hypothetical protein HHK36_023198 [Tetracentron sinense]|uniref:Uncharacterized protein n=1 Tax=Tetracentron sinense TaxID=13715 RepID=A0A834YKU9_TETSI|nr:hypothetical protein HHK36_023198 [Tetracentron sinense]